MDALRAVKVPARSDRSRPGRSGAVGGSIGLPIFVNALGCVEEC